MFGKEVLNNHLKPARSWPGDKREVPNCMAMTLNGCLITTSQKTLRVVNKSDIWKSEFEC